MLGGFDVGLQLFSPWFLPWGRLLLAIWGSCLGPRQPVSLTVDICHECFWFPHGPELLVTLVFGLGLCSEGTGSICLVLYKVVLQALPIPDFIDCLHWLSADGVQGYPVVIVFDKVEEGILRLLEVIIKTNGSCLVEKLQFLSPLSPSVLARKSLSTSDFGWCILHIVRNFVVFVSRLARSCNVQFFLCYNK